ncbi:hypothetical protein PAAG_11997 [Paracoccidioides lutzii Pb01]|uniref:Uncharacterized protein n=1 Tax=Paracoccidioides lutzii (strain ATCC MYA-826 / Pb01) TaxID=502779 RepID=A0A0A2V4N0_PARBA|nr:hypothetical protein PAAG_11997 [Paracoccidioides lutzii Pb01]KGQ01317.1 hypothetical protein PAAG_11997 [Paracoccidioides lutzii Pb01]
MDFGITLSHFSHSTVGCPVCVSNLRKEPYWPLDPYHPPHFPTIETLRTGLAPRYHSKVLAWFQASRSAALVISLSLERKQKLVSEATVSHTREAQSRSQNEIGGLNVECFGAWILVFAGIQESRKANAEGRMAMVKEQHGGNNTVAWIRAVLQTSVDNSYFTTAPLKRFDHFDATNSPVVTLQFAPQQVFSLFHWFRNHLNLIPALR